jgi:hypothetical protein
VKESEKYLNRDNAGKKQEVTFLSTAIKKKKIIV